MIQPIVLGQHVVCEASACAACSISAGLSLYTGSSAHRWIETGPGASVQGWSGMGMSCSPQPGSPVLHAAPVPPTPASTPHAAKALE